MPVCLQACLNFWLPGCLHPWLATWLAGRLTACIPGFLRDCLAWSWFPRCCLMTDVHRLGTIVTQPPLCAVLKAKMVWPVGRAPSRVPGKRKREGERESERYGERGRGGERESGRESVRERERARVMRQQFSMSISTCMCPWYGYHSVKEALLLLVTWGEGSSWCFFFSIFGAFWFGLGMVVGACSNGIRCLCMETTSL